MPSVKQGGGYTLTFAKKNSDVKYILDNEKEKGTIITNYICEAIRFYYCNKDAIDINISNDDIESIIAKKVNEILKDKLGSNLEENITEESKNYDLEDDTFIDDSDLEED